MAFIYLLSYFLLNAEQIHSHAIFFPLYAFDFNFCIQGYILIKSIASRTQLKLFIECKMLVVVVAFVIAVFAVVSKTLQKRNFLE